MDQTAALGFIERRVDVPSHICLFYYDDTELRERLQSSGHGSTFAFAMPLASGADPPTD